MQQQEGHYRIDTVAAAFLRQLPVTLLDRAGPWLILPAFWLQTNLENLVRAAGVTASDNLVYPQSALILYSLLILFSALRWGGRAVAPALTLMGLHLVGFRLGSETQLSVSVSDPYNVPIYYLALRYGLDPARVAMRWQGLRRDWTDYAIVALMTLVAVQVSLPNVYFAASPWLDVLFAMILLIGLRPLWPWLSLFVVGAALHTMLDILTGLPESIQELSLGTVALFNAHFATDAITTPLALLAAAGLLRLRVAFWNRAVAAAIAFVLVAVTPLLRLALDLDPLMPSYSFASTLLKGPFDQILLLCLAVHIVGRPARLWLLIGAGGGALVFLLVQTLTPQLSDATILSWPGMVAIETAEYASQEAQTVFYVTTRILFNSGVLLLFWWIVDSLRGNPAAPVGNPLLQGTHVPVDGRVPGKLTLLFGKEGVRWLLGGLVALVLVMVALGVAVVVEGAPVEGPGAGQLNQLPDMADPIQQTAPEAGGAAPPDATAPADSTGDNATRTVDPPLEWETAPTKE